MELLWGSWTNFLFFIALPLFNRFFDAFENNSNFGQKVLTDDDDDDDEDGLLMSL